jgi:bla regulator protein blaR1
MNMIRSTSGFALAILLAATAASAQDPAAPSAAASPDATFEVASIKPSNPDPTNPLSMVPMMRPQPGGRLTVTNLPLKMLIGFAYEMQDFRVDGGPPALMNAKYDIIAKASGGATLTPKEMRPLVKNLLIERFKLKAHTEPREMRIYDLVVARSDGRLGRDIKPSTSDCSKADELNAKRAEALSKGDLSAVMPKPGEVLPCTLAPNVAGGPANISVHGDGQDIKQLIELLGPMTGRYVRDKTGLTGRYDFDMKLDLAQLLAMARGMGMNIPAGAEANLPQSDGSSLMTALSEQLGLKLDSVRAPVDVLVIDGVEAPALD